LFVLLTGGFAPFCIQEQQAMADESSASDAASSATVDLRRPNHFTELMQHCRSRDVQDRFRVLGMVPYRDVQSLMQHAHAVINPSRFEGWSTAVEEARTMGKQLLLSDIPVHREQAPAGTLFFGVDDPAELAGAMHATLARASIQAAPADLQRSFATRLCEFGQAYLQIARNFSVSSAQ
jgi:glycosyltransferase involved in cell wall biosynthesis